jgi:carboxylesterase type B
MLTAEESEYNYQNLSIRTGCSLAQDSLSCLQNLSIDVLQQANIAIPFPQATMAPLYSWAPTIDGSLIPDLTYQLFEEGRFLHVPTIFGDDTNEGTVFVPQRTASVSDANTFIQDQFPYISSEQLAWFDSTYLSEPDSQTYPNSGPYWEGTSNGYGEVRYICPGIALSELFTTLSVFNTWSYHYAVIDDAAIADGYGTTHTIELNAIWGPENTNGNAPPSYYTTNAAIVPFMQGYWTSFIRSYDPNPYRYPGSPEWVTWADGLLTSYNRLFIRTNETQMETVPSDQKERCAYLTSIGPDLQQRTFLASS